MVLTDKTLECVDCSRNHTADQPCPRRLAKALLTGDASKLTPADVASKRATLTHLQVEDVLEDFLADNLGS